MTAKSVCCGMIQKFIGSHCCNSMQLISDEPRRYVIVSGCREPEMQVRPLPHLTAHIPETMLQSGRNGGRCGGRNGGRCGAEGSQVGSQQHNIGSNHHSQS